MAKEQKKIASPAQSSAATYLTFVAATGESDEHFEMRYEDENIWLSQRMMAELYDVSVAAISQHIKRIYEDGELTQEATVKQYLTVQTEGMREVRRAVAHDNLQMILMVQDRVYESDFDRFILPELRGEE